MAGPGTARERVQALWGRPRAAAVEPQQPACCRAAKAAPGTPPIAPPLPTPPIAPPLPPAVAATAVHHRCRDPQPSLPPCRDRPPWVRASIAASTTAAKRTTSLLTTTRRRGAQPRAALSRALTACPHRGNLLHWEQFIAMGCNKLPPVQQIPPSAINCPQCKNCPQCRTDPHARRARRRVATSPPPTSKRWPLAGVPPPP